MGEDKMAGLVDYGVDSEDDIIHGNSPKSTKVTTPPVCDDLNSDTEKPSSKTSKTKSEEVLKKSSKSKNCDKTRHKERHRRRSRSRSKDRHNRKHRRKRSQDRDKHHHGERRKRRSKSRSRSRSTSPRRNQRHVRRTRSQERREKKAAAIERMGLDVNSLAASVATSGTSNEKSAAMAAAQQVLQNQVEQVQQMTGVALPSFYNPGAVNPMKYAQQIQKRKQLWANKEKKEAQPTMTSKIWEATAFNQDLDGKMTAKFKRMMGIKTEQAGSSQPEGAAESNEVLKKQQELFASLDQQYQVARATTHIQRGLGLGFSSNNSFPR